MIPLTPRLEAVAKAVLPGKVIVDVGTDHAYLPIYLIESGVIPAAIATEINNGPYQIAREKAKIFCLTEKIDVRKGDGLTPVKAGEAQVAVIAGMGGLTIINILMQSSAVVKELDQLVLQPMTAPEAVRKWLAINGWMLAREQLIKEENKYYQVINALKGEQSWPGDENDLVWQFGPKLVDNGDRLLIEYLNIMLEANERLLVKLHKVGTPGGKLRVLALEQEIVDFKELIIKCRLNASK